LTCVSGATPVWLADPTWHAALMPVDAQLRAIVVAPLVQLGLLVLYHNASSFVCEATLVVSTRITPCILLQGGVLTWLTERCLLLAPSDLLRWCSSLGSIGSLGKCCQAR